MLKRFPRSDSTGESKTNAAIKLYGRRFYKDQTPVEYLAELFLVFVSPKGEKDAQLRAFTFSLGQPDERAIYYPDDGLALKLFAFFPTSKLETRHAAHHLAYKQIIDVLHSRIDGTDEERDEAIRLLQSILSGFVGVARNRTWATYTFLPAADSLLSRELDWLQSKAKDKDLACWNQAQNYFATDRHNFLARGGGLLFLQLAHLFSDNSAPFRGLASEDRYDHLCDQSLPELRSELEHGLKTILRVTAITLNRVVDFVSGSLNEFQLEHNPHATLGWIPAATIPESYLFAFEFRNIAYSGLPDLEKIDLMQLLCCLQVMRTICFQSHREDSATAEVQGFAGKFVWITSDLSATPKSPGRKLAATSLERVEQVLYRVLRQENLTGGSMTEADRHGFQIFRKLGKEIGLIVPKTGKGQRFVLPAHLLRFLVTALLRPGEYLRLDRFYERVFAHYGIAIGERQLAAALSTLDGANTGRDYAVSANTAWIEEALRQGGFLVELSDAVSIVHSPGARPDAG